jgi:OOP family OmpA-OmpF porin
MKKLILILLLNAIAKLGDAQINLVPNSSFENYFNLNANGNLVENFIYNWYGGRGYLHVNRSDPYYSVPANGFGYQYPHTGNAYCGIYTYLKNSYPIRHYIQTRLMDTLTAGKKYRVAFYVSLGDTLHAFNNSIGAYFATDSLYTVNNSVIDATPQIINNYTNDLDNKTEWTLVCDTFVASGGESWITIGNFLNDSLSLVTPLDSICSQPLGWGCGSYYYIDDVSVTLIEETGLVNKKLNDFSIFPNPNYGTFKLLLKGTLTKSYILSITDLYGNQLDNIEIINSTTEYENARLKNGLYFYTIRQGIEELGRGKFMVIH